VPGLPILAPKLRSKLRFVVDGRGGELARAPAIDHGLDVAVGKLRANPAAVA